MHFESWKSALAPKLHGLVEFLASQGITMAGNLLYGFLCVRLLSISDYAKFVVVFGILGTLVVLMDIGFSNNLLALVGERIDDRQLIADYVASLRQLAHWLYLIVAPILVVAYPLLVRKQQWSWHVVAAMLLILLVASWCARVSGAYGSVLIVRRDRTVWYRAQMISSLGTLLLLGIVWAAHWLNAFSAILINVSGIVFLATMYFFRARQLLGVRGHSSREKRKEIVHLTLPSMPNVIFYALQGQIALLLITIFGHTTAVAGIGALSRLGQIFALLGQMNPLLIEPYFANLPRERLKRNYLSLLAIETALCVFTVIMAALFPEIFLWILGPKYSNLRFELLLFIAGSSASYLAGMLWIVHSSRRFVYWWNGIMVITSTLAVEILFIWKVDLSTMRAVLILNLCTALAGLVINLSTGVYGFIWGPRNIPQAQPVAAGFDHA